MSEIPKQYQELPDEELEEYLEIARLEFSPEQLAKTSFYKEWIRRNK